MPCFGNFHPSAFLRDRQDQARNPLNCLAGTRWIVLLESMNDLIEAMGDQGWASVPDYLACADSSGLRAECQAAWEKGEFRRAGVGRGAGLEVREEIRRDEVMWLDPDRDSKEQNHYLAGLEILRLALNQKFFLGLATFDGHFAIYPEGAFYKPHLDRHSGSSNRIVTVILYLNPDWLPGDGGELKLWTTAGDREGEFVLIEPRMGTLVSFLSADFWHEVLPAKKSRMSITGWFNQR